MKRLVLVLLSAALLAMSIFFFMRPSARADPGNSITSPDTSGVVGLYTSLALDASGYPVVSYFDATNWTLKVLHCNDANCAGGDESITAPDVSCYSPPSLALDASGYPVVGYCGSALSLKVLHCNDPNCVGGDESITSQGQVHGTPFRPSIALDGSGNPVVSYPYLSHPSELRLLHCNDPNCAGGDESITSPDTVGHVGRDARLALDASGYPVVGYGGSGLYVLHCNDANCAGGDESITAPDTAGNVGSQASPALDASGNPVVSYSDGNYNYDLKVLHCNDANCAGGDESITAPDTAGYVGDCNSLALDGDGYPVVSYYDYTNGDLKVLHCGNANCTSGNSITSPDTAGDVGWFTSLALDANGYPVVSYYDQTNGDLKLLHCVDPNCTGVAPVGGIAELGDMVPTAAARSGPSARDYIALTAAAAVVLLALTGGAWYARRRRLR